MSEHHGDHGGHGEHHHRTMERHCDVAVVGGSAAGLAAALQIARQRRSVIVVDSGSPRNAPAAHLHGYLGHEGVAPSELMAIGREEVRSHGAEVLDGRVVDVVRHDGRFRLELTGGHVLVARRVLVATGIVDELPDIDGVAEQWGRGVIHCPFCHGYEVRDQQLVQLVTHPMGLHPTPLFRQLSERLTIVLHDGVDPELPEVAALRDAGVTVVVGRARCVVTGPDGGVEAVELDGGERLAADAVVVGTRFVPRLEAFSSLGLAAQEHPSGLGGVVAVDPTGATDVDGVYAAGNVTDPSQQVLAAAANGSWVGSMISFSLAQEDLTAGAQPSANAADWDHRYGGEHMWSGNPNGALVAEVSGMAPGRALDVGAGEGGDAVWLAEQGWTVTANDVSQRALERVADAAASRGLDVGTCHADANSLDPFAGERFDLVSAHYASIPRTPDGRAIEHLIGAVAPGGTLLVVGHDLAPMRGPIDTAQQSRAFDPDAYVRVDDVAEVLRDLPGWTIEIHELRARPAGATSSHHVDDVVLRARRSG
jgi:thioredoxin reductase/SAM-dependent methyltransferase